MKIRRGFVSNSSSSSFIIIGVKFTHSQAEKLFTEEQKDDIYGVLESKAKEWDLEMLCDDTEYYVGHILADDRCGDAYLSNGSLNLEEIKKQSQEIKKVIPDADVRIWYGTRAS